MLHARTLNESAIVAIARNKHHLEFPKNHATLLMPGEIRKEATK